MRRLFSVVFWGFVVLSSLALFPLAVLIFLVTAPFDHRRALLHRFTCFWASLYTWLNPAWPVTIHRRARLYDAGGVLIDTFHSRAIGRTCVGAVFAQVAVRAVARLSLGGERKWKHRGNLEHQPA